MGHCNVCIYRLVFNLETVEVLYEIQEVGVAGGGASLTWVIVMCVYIGWSSTSRLC